MAAATKPVKKLAGTILDPILDMGAPPPAAEPPALSPPTPAPAPEKKQASGAPTDGLMARRRRRASSRVATVLSEASETLGG